jgi:hypothetical protein
MRDTGSTAASAQSPGKRKFTVSDGAMSGMVATIVVDDCGGRPPRALKPAARPPTPAPPRMARHATTLRLIVRDRPRISPTLLTPECWLHLLCKPSVIMAGEGHFFGVFPLVHEGVSDLGAPPAGGMTEKSPASPPGSRLLLRWSSDQAASSSTTASSSSPSGGLGPRRGPLASAASISLIASVSVMRCTAEISRESRSSAAS